MVHRFDVGELSVALGQMKAPVMRVARVATALAVAVGVLALTPPAAEAVVRTSTGLACTVVGTAGNDVLAGTARRDVICGRGGNDTLRGGAGDDVLDGGTGNDRLVGADGRDLLLGGAGRDTLTGAAGSDRLLGGDGADVLTGGVGDDRLLGGDGPDLATGGDGRDAVLGQQGDDDLTGGTGTDDVDGGAGFNLCDVPTAGDQQVRCAIDAAPPVVHEVIASPVSVDVSDEYQLVRVRAHVTDDTGVKQVQAGNAAALVSGSLRDGTWSGVIRVPRYITPGPRDLTIVATDRVGRTTYADRSDAYTVVNTVVDQEHPVLRSLTLSADSLDVRTTAKSLTGTVRITDDLAGADDVFLCPAHAFPSGEPSFRHAGACAFMPRTSGTATDATHRGTLTIPQDAPSGTWNVFVWIGDASGNFDTDFWLAPDQLRAEEEVFGPGLLAIPGGAGAFTVTGKDVDTHAPVLTALTVDPAPLDTSGGAVTVTADIAGTDVEGITGAELFISGYAGYPNNPTWTDTVDVATVLDFQRVSGTAQDGVWRATFVVPGGTPSGEYFIHAVLADSSHWESWVSPDSGMATSAHVLDDNLAPTGTRFVVANSG